MGMIKKLKKKTNLPSKKTKQHPRRRRKRRRKTHPKKTRAVATVSTPISYPLTCHEVLFQPNLTGPNFDPADLPRFRCPEVLFQPILAGPNFVPADLPRFRCPEVLIQPNLTGPYFVPADLPRGVNPNFVPADLPRGDGMPSAQFKTDLRDFSDGDTRDEEDMPPVYYDAPDDYFMDEEGVGQSSGGGSDRTSYIVIWDHEE